MSQRVGSTPLVVELGDNGTPGSSSEVWKRGIHASHPQDNNPTMRGFTFLLHPGVAVVICWSESGDGVEVLTDEID
jgi:hypothetical protein